jgi:hypothetical protein
MTFRYAWSEDCCLYSYLNRCNWWSKVFTQLEPCACMYVRMYIYEDRLKSSSIHVFTPSRNSVEVRWRSLFRSTNLGKRFTSYNAPLTSRKCAADRWSLRNFLHRSSLFMVGKAQKSHGARSRLYDGCSNGVPPIHVFQVEHRIQFRSRQMRFLGFFNH